ncbi:hypothetical protein DNK08_15520 [Stutzerimonas kirkiae]|nr:hypothetical protein DNK08_15520 [Stutzerimonas kirkiae]
MSHATGWSDRSRAAASGKRQAASGKRQAASGKRQAASGKRQAASGKRQAASIISVKSPCGTLSSFSLPLASAPRQKPPRRRGRLPFPPRPAASILAASGGGYADL